MVEFLSPMLTNSNKFGKFYITSAIPYVNARPHIGHALEFVQADALKRYQALRGKEVLLLSGSDENALKNVQAAVEAGVPVRDFVDANAKLFQELAAKLNVGFDVFQKGGDEKHHFPSSQELWRRCQAAGDIYKKSYEGLYCVGCETFYIADELDTSGECLEHPGKKLEKVSEENYFFRLSKYQGKLTRLISSGELKIIPETRKNEVLSFLKKPLHDISISRTNERAKNWGVPVPGDPNQRIYVWFDALNIYQSGVGFGWDDELYNKWWPADVHVIGKGIIRFHAVYWPAFLLSAGLPLPKSLLVHGYITVDGQKMSKTLGNIVDPFELIERYGADTLRYYFLREIPSHGDGDFSERRLRELYNGELANGLGNLVARVAALGEKISPIKFDFQNGIRAELKKEADRVFQSYEKAFSELKLNEALAAVGQLVGWADRYINATKPWAVSERGELAAIIVNASFVISTIATLVKPFIPATAQRIEEQIKFRYGAVEIKKGEGLFPRLE